MPLQPGAGLGHLGGVLGCEHALTLYGGGISLMLSVGSCHGGSEHPCNMEPLKQPKKCGLGEDECRWWRQPPMVWKSPSLQEPWEARNGNAVFTTLLGAFSLM